MGIKLNYTYNGQNRIGDHICYISDLTKIQTHFPDWQLEYDLSRIFCELVEQYTRRDAARPEEVLI